MEKVNKGALGGYGKSKSPDDYTHVIYTKDEHNTKNFEIKNLKDNTKKLEDKHKAELEHYKNSADDAIKEIRKQAQAQIAEANNRADGFENLNKNLIRVATERANAKRKLTPVKQHTGYVFLSVEEFTFHCECLVSGKTSKKTVLKLPCFRVRLQSPYDVTFERKSVIDLIDDDILNKIGVKMGVSASYSGNFDKYNEDEVRKIWAEDENFLFKISHKAVFQNKNFWEVEFFTRDMPIVPSDMLAKTEMNKKIM